jgi:hypothetical protein
MDYRDTDRDTYRRPADRAMDARDTDRGTDRATAEKLERQKRLEELQLKDLLKKSIIGKLRV